ncbi:hypothetical protein C943_03069 [Mariniradius saccharolyticus AK6]|uniref:Uncharacterized protein n=1 Tax=Mariniradius saccharolyticus AK6 TaxID=1239962 RepID=M7X7D7_9BACT|nr:hypothetical protein C943_03069 [Mariniradius saccharolyticus AK6]
MNGVIGDFDDKSVPKSTAMFDIAYQNNKFGGYFPNHFFQKLNSD